MPQHPLPTIKELLSYRLHQVANLLSRGAEMRYRREFGVSLWEWRSVALLGGAGEPQSLNDLARAAGMDKGQMSRVVSGLTARKMIFRETDANDARAIRLSLSAPGKKLYQKLIHAAAQRNRIFLACLSAQERACLEQAMRKLASAARNFIQEEKRTGL
ncbi:MAG: MarR family transcriptional regulator [Betaproteobacteria bacterium]|nr:MarR family transcriptional regulator [Betaproteobacteria bacterium]MSQ88736.1 MarR family transcriptional regulator [Betaproteobacteria bacterium]